MSITDERKKRSTSPTSTTTHHPIAVPKDSDITDATDAGLDGKILGAQSSTTHSNYAEEKLGSADLRLYPTPDEYKLDIASGRIDAVIDDVIVLSEWLETPDGECCKILGTLTPDPVINGEGAGIAIRKGEDDLREMFNTAIAAIRSNGKIQGNQRQVLRSRRLWRLIKTSNEPGWRARPRHPNFEGTNGELAVADSDARDTHPAEFRTRWMGRSDRIRRSHNRQPGGLLPYPLGSSWAFFWRWRNRAMSALFEWPQKFTPRSFAAFLNS